MGEHEELDEGQALDYEAPALSEFGRVEDYTQGIGISVIVDIFP